LRRRHGWLDHLARTGRRYLEHRGYQMAATISYFSVLSLVPLLMLALSVTGYVLAGQPALLASLRGELAASVPPTLSPLLNDLFGNVVDHRLGLGIAGIVVAGYSGWNWMNALRDALTGMWQLARLDQPLLDTVLADLLSLFGLGLALLVTFGATAAGGVLAPMLLDLLGLGSSGPAHVLLTVGSVVVAIGADWLIFLWVLARLPRRPVTVRQARWPALACALGFELLKRIANIYLAALGRSPTGVTFGSVVGVLVFAYLVARMVVLAAAWIATEHSGGDSRPEDANRR
jgi:membrane protein